MLPCNDVICHFVKQTRVRYACLLVRPYYVGKILRLKVIEMIQCNDMIGHFVKQIKMCFLSLGICIYNVGKRLGIAVATSPEPSTLEAAMELEKSLKLVDDCSRCTDDLIGSLESPYEAEELLEAVDSFVPSVEAMAKMALEVGKDLDEMPALQVDLEVATEEIRVTAKEMLN